MGGDMYRPWTCRWGVVNGIFGLLMIVGSVHAQQYSGVYEPADIEYGLAVYRAQCVTCHGDTGDGVPTVDLRSGTFRQAVTDRDLSRLIRNGLSGTGMPPFDLDTAESTGIIAYLRNMTYEADVVALGDGLRGRILFEGSGECSSCHRVSGQGPRLAPELTAIGSQRSPGALRRSLLDPTGAMRPINRPVVMVTLDGERVSGRRLNEDTYTLQIIDEQERLRSFDKAVLREYTVQTESPMPSYADRLTANELADLLAYLVSLKG